MKGVLGLVIIYKSNTGYTREYAKLLGKELELPVYSADSIPQCHRGKDVIFLGWVMAGGIMGFRKVSRSCNIRCVCGVGMGPPMPELVSGFRKKMRLPAGMPVFYLQGGFDISRLKGPYQLIMQMKVKEIAARLAAKPTLTEEERATLEMTRGAVNCVSPERLAPVAAWYRSL